MLTPHDLAIQRAADAIKRLDAMIEALRASGPLSIFDRTTAQAVRRRPLWI